MRPEDLIRKVKLLIGNEVKVEINGRTDHEIEDIYIDGKGTICIAIKLDEDYIKYLS